MTDPQDRGRAPNFAPVSGANSGGLRLAAGYFILSGILTALFLCAALVSIAVRPAVAATVKNHVLIFSLGLAVQLIVAAGWIWTGVLLGRRSRLGGILAVAFMLVPLVSAAAPVSIGTATIVFSIIGLIVVASVWNELR
jgi:hypothetical protein